MLDPRLGATPCGGMRVTAMCDLLPNTTETPSGRVYWGGWGASWSQVSAGVVSQLSDRSPAPGPARDAGEITHLGAGSSVSGAHVCF